MNDKKEGEDGLKARGIEGFQRGEEEEGERGHDDGEKVKESPPHTITKERELSFGRGPITEESKRKNK